MNPTSSDLDHVRELYRSERDRRIRPDGNDQFPRIEGALTALTRDPDAKDTATRQSVTRSADAVVIGGGMGGILAAGQLKRAGLSRVCVIEKGADFGGTWHWNRYPGAQCDVESYIYLPMLEELDYVPSEKYAHQPEILAHLKRIAEHFELYEAALFETEVIRAVWDDKGWWQVSTAQGDRITARYLVVVPGDQHNPRLPAIPGIESFAGRAFHTSRWDHECTGEQLERLAGLRVGVIGTGATGVQAVPPLAASAEHLYVFQRTPTPVLVRANAATDTRFTVSRTAGWQRARMINFTSVTTGVNVDEDLVDDSWTYNQQRIIEPLLQGHALDSEEAQLADLRVMDEVRNRVDDLVADPRVAEALKPYYRFVCKRPTFHDEFLQAFNRDNVTLVETAGKGVDAVVPSGVIVQDRLYELDVLVFATGFEVGSGFSRTRSFEVIGRDGVSLGDAWKHGTRTLHGVLAHGFPNCFLMGLTQIGITPNFAHTLVEQAEHIGYLAAEAERRDVLMEATEEAEADWVRQIEESQPRGELQTYQACTPGYLNNEGQADDPLRILAGRYGHGPMAFFALLEAWRGEGTLAGVELRSRRSMPGTA